MKNMLNALWLAAILVAFWMVNSGYFKPLLLIFGVCSVLAVLFIVRRMQVVDSTSYPVIMPVWRLPFYLLWLAKEIIVSNIDVVRRIWSPSTISPTIIRFKASQKSDVGRVLFANSITMTPGTVTLDLSGQEFEVHALTKEGAQGVLSGEMDRRVSRLEA